MLHRQPPRWLLAGLFLLILSLAATEALATPYGFATSNTFGAWSGALPPGYGTVNVIKEATGLYFEVSANPAFFSSSDNLTWDKFYFNINPARNLPATAIVSDQSEGSWRVVQNRNVATFGTFDFGLEGRAIGNSGIDPLQFHIADPTLEISDILLPNEDDWIFAGHLRRFDAIDGASSTFLAGDLPPNDTTPVPEPGTLLLLGSGLLGTVLGRKRLGLG